MSKVMSFSSRPTFENAIALKTLSPLISIRAAIVEKSWDSSWLSDIRPASLPSAGRIAPVPSRQQVREVAATLVEHGVGGDRPGGTDRRGRKYAGHLAARGGRGRRRLRVVELRLGDDLRRLLISVRPPHQPGRRAA